MTAPSAVTRIAPSGSTYFDKGHKVTLAFAANTSVRLWEISLTLPEITGGDEINTTTQHNTSVRTKAPRTLKDYGPIQGTVAFNQHSLTDVVALINVATTVTVLLPNSTTFSAYAYLKSFAPTEFSEDADMPTAEIEVVITNWDPVNNVEEPPVIA